MRGFGVFLWEQWRQTHKGLGFVGATLLVYALLLLFVRQLIYFIFSLNIPIVVGAAYLPAIGAIVLLFIQENRGRVGFAYPRRMLVLPVPTYVLVGVPLVYRLAVIAAFATATGWVCDTLVRDLFFSMPQVMSLLILTTAAHALVFLVCGYGAATGAAIFAACFLLSLPIARIPFHAVITNINIPQPLPEGYVPPIIGMEVVWAGLACMAFWFLAAYQGARYARSEVAEDPVGGFVHLATRLTYFDRDRAQFPSAESAQTWLEWRRGAYLFPWLSLLLGLVLLLSFQAVAGQLETRFVLSLNLFALAPAVVACLVGYTITRSGSDYLWFVGARPLTTAAISRARLKAGVKAILWGYALLVPAYVIAFKLQFPGEPIIPSLVQDLRVITSTQGPFAEGLALLAFLSIATVLGVWALFWLARSAGVMVWPAGVVVAVWYAMAGEVYSDPSQTGLFTTPTMVFLWSMSGLLGFMAAATILTAFYRRYFKAITLAAVAVAWMALILLAHSLSNIVSLGGPLLIAMWLLLPFVPLASIPLTLEWQRHR